MVSTYFPYVRVASVEFVQFPVGTILRKLTARNASPLLVVACLRVRKTR